MKCKQCLREKEKSEFLTYYKTNRILYTYHVCKECYSNTQSKRMLGTHPSPEAIEKMAASKRGVKQSPEHIEKKASKLRGRLHERDMDIAGISWIRFTETQLKKHESEVIRILSKQLNLVEAI